ncbi:MAG: hypothetical protein ABJC13_04040 [Acidobacteriota bacterium]
MRTQSLRRLRWQLALLVVVYFFAGATSQKLLPGVDEIIPLYGWSLFSKIPNEDSRYVLLILRQRKRNFQPAVPFPHAPETLVIGNRYIGRKVIQRLGRAIEKGEADKVKDLRLQLETSYLVGRVRYEVVFERYDPVQKWKTGANLESLSLGEFASGENL